jgi:hypothetical protein
MEKYRDEGAPIELDKACKNFEASMNEHAEELHVINQTLKREHHYVPQYANVYLADRAFGGQEEGGWWFDCGMPEESHKCESFYELAHTVERLKAKYDPMNAGMPDKSSVNCEGIYEVMVQDHPAKAYPEQAPHYE